MTHGDPDRERRRAELVQRPQRQAGGRPVRTVEAKPAKAGGGRRFAARNAIVHGGWLAVLSPSELRAWTVLDTLSDESARVRVGGTRLGELAGLRREHALAAVASLVRRGLVRRTVRGNSGRGTRRTSNEYAMLAPDAAVATEPEEPD
jgi:hypothetical protein